MDDIIVSQNNNAIVQPEAPERVHEQAPVLIQENILQDGGIAATITVGTTTTLDPDSAAYVRNVGDEKHAVLQFGIPKGETGVSGVDGTDGQAATIQIGSVETVDSASDAAVENVGTENAAVLNFSIPRGEQGIQGEQGYSPVAYVQQIQGGARIHIADSQTETDVDVMDGQDGADGQSATITVGSTTTGAAGTNASVVNSGTSSAAVLDFTIPRGADGQDGSDGSDGFSPIATVSQTQSGATISITDSQGTTTANISNGTDGAAGQAATISVGSTTTGAAGTNASVVNSGTSSAAVLDFTIPRGTDGQDGADGQSATITVGTTTTGAAGTNASVVNSGTSSAAILDFVIPRGADGDSNVPDIIEGTGDSAGSTAVKYPDGTLICYGRWTLNGFNVSSAYQNSYYGTLNRNNCFPVSFISEPAATVSVKHSGRLLTANFSGKSTTGFSLYIWGQYQSTNLNSVGVDYVAIGKWK